MRLIDCFMELIIYVVHTVRNIEQYQPDFQNVQNEIDGLLKKSLKCKESTSMAGADYDYARLSVCVWIDEALMNSAWIHTPDWQKHKLQRRYHNITDGGQEFFERLDKLGHDDRNAREVAYYCLILGLAGRYIEKGDGVVLDHLKTKHLKRLLGSSAGEPSLENRQLFPEAYQRKDDAPVRSENRTAFKGLSLMIGLIPIGLFLAMMAVYHYLLNFDLQQFAGI